MIDSVLLAAVCAMQAPETAPLPLLLPRARDETEAGFARIELVVPRRECFLHEALRVRVQFGLEREFLRTAAVQPFVPRLDVPVQIVAPWSAGLPGARALELAETAPGPDEPLRPTCALNETIRVARRIDDRIVDGRTFAMFELEIGLLPTAVGELALPAPVLVLAHARSFEDSLFDARVPIDRVDAFVRGEPLVLDVRPWPEEGRPRDFTGAVGSFSVSARLSSRSLRSGESVKLELRIEGEGNLNTFEAPTWRELGGFRVLGMIDERTPAARVLTLDLMPDSDREWQVPALSFAYLDPGPPAAYRVARTEPIDVAIASAESPERAPSPAVALPGAERPRHWTWAIAVGGVLIVLGVLLLAGRRRCQEVASVSKSDVPRGESRGDPR